MTNAIGCADPVTTGCPTLTLDTLSCVLPACEAPDVQLDLENNDGALSLAEGVAAAPTSVGSMVNVTCDVPGGLSYYLVVSVLHQ